MGLRTSWSPYFNKGGRSTEYSLPCNLCNHFDDCSSCFVIRRHLYSLYPAVTDDGKCWNNEWARLAVSARNKSRVKKPVQKSGRIKRQKGKCCSQSSGMWNGRHYFFDLVPLWRIFWFLMTCLGRGFIPVLNGCTPSTARRGFRVSFITSVFLAGERGHWG